MIAFGLPLPPGLPPAPLGLPVGCVIAFAGEVSSVGAPPTPYTLDVERWGWMLCDGRALPISQHPELFAVLGFRYLRAGEATALPTDAAAAAAATFRLPDYRGLFLRGVSGDSGVDPDAASRLTISGATSSAVGSLQQHALQNHQHTYSQPSKLEVGAGGAPGAGQPEVPAETTQPPQPQDNADVFFTSKGETRPKNLSVHYLILATNGSAPLSAAHLPAMGPRLPGGGR